MDLLTDLEAQHKEPLLRPVKFVLGLTCIGSTWTQLVYYLGWKFLLKSNPNHPRGCWSFTQDLRTCSFDEFSIRNFLCWKFLTLCHNLFPRYLKLYALLMKFTKLTHVQFTFFCLSKTQKFRIFKPFNSNLSFVNSIHGQYFEFYKFRELKTRKIQ